LIIRIIAQVGSLFMQEASCAKKKGDFGGALSARCVREYKERQVHIVGSQFAYTAHSCSRAFTCCRNKLYNLSIFITRVRPRRRRQCALLFLSRSFCVIVCKPAAAARSLRAEQQQFYVNTHLKSPRCLYLYCNKASFARLFYSYTKCKTINSPRGEIPALLSAEQMYVVHTAHTRAPRGHTHKARTLHGYVLCTYTPKHTQMYQVLRLP
jgi:hypothetical protein